jgi:hypothetical protein
MAPSRGRVPTRTLRQERERRNARLLGLAGFLGAAALPAVLWHRAISIIASDFRLDLGYLVTGWMGYGLIGLGLLFLLPVIASIGSNPEHRRYPRSRNAYAGWGVSLYLLGIALASQVAAVAHGHHVP